MQRWLLLRLTLQLTTPVSDFTIHSSNGVPYWTTVEVNSETNIVVRESKWDTRVPDFTTLHGMLRRLFGKIVSSWSLYYTTYYVLQEQEESSVRDVSSSKGIIVSHRSCCTCLQHLVESRLLLSYVASHTATHCLCQCFIATSTCSVRLEWHLTGDAK